MTSIYYWLIVAVVFVFCALRGLWDMWAQTAFVLFISACSILMFAGRLRAAAAEISVSGIVGFILAALAGVSCLLSPMGGVSAPFAIVWLAAFAAGILARGEAETAVRDGVFYSALFASALAVYQFFAGYGVTGFMFNPNVFAGFMAAVCVWAYMSGKRLYAAIFFAAVILSASKGAAAVLVLLALPLVRRFRFRWYIAGGAAAFLTALLWVGRHSLAERFVWWTDALRMALHGGLWGFGPGTFGYVFPAFHKPAGVLATIYAHSFPLELWCEFGPLFLLLLAGWIGYRLINCAKPQRYAALALLLISLQDFTLSVPLNLALLFVLLCSGDEKTFTLPDRGRAFSAALLFIAASALIGVCGTEVSHWRFQKELLRAQANGDACMLAEHYGGYYQPALMCAEQKCAYAFSKKSTEALASAALYYERALRLNPYRPPTYDSLAEIYRLRGDNALADAALAQKKAVLKWKE